MTTHDAEARADIVALLEQLHILEHEQDRALIDAIAKKYGWKPWQSPRRKR